MDEEARRPTEPTSNHAAPTPPDDEKSSPLGNWYSAYVGEDNTAPITIGNHNWVLHQQVDRGVFLPPGTLRTPAEVDAPPRMNTLPADPSYFVGRTTALEQLDRSPAASGRAVVQVVYGLGGIGKSALVAHWAATRDHGHSPVRWIEADSGTNVQEGLARLAVALQPGLLPVLDQRDIPSDMLAEWALQWLASHDNWLLILDNVVDPKDIEPLLSRATGGRFILTSRLAIAWPQGGDLIALEVLKKRESVDLITHKARKIAPHRSLDGAASLCKKLGHLPLAIEQVGAFLAQNPLVTPHAYLHMLDDYAEKLFAHAAVGTDPEQTIALVWRLTLETITDSTGPLPGDLLRILAWYGPKAIPLDLVRKLADPASLSTAIGTLNAYSMVAADHIGNALNIHRLVQAVSRTADTNGSDPDLHRSPDRIDLACRTAATALHAIVHGVVPVEDPANWPLLRTLLPHIEAFASLTRPETDTETIVSVYMIAGLFLQRQGLINPALRHLERALSDQSRLFGAGDPKTLRAQNNLALAYRAAWDLDHAIPLFEQVLPAISQSLGENHLDTLTVRANLAGAYIMSGEPDRAIPLLRQVLDERIRQLSRNHRDSLLALGSLAGAYQDAGDLNQAIMLFEECLEGANQVLVPDDPDLFFARHNLAHSYHLAGRHDEAMPLLNSVLADRKRVLGNRHPETMSTVDSIANIYWEVGDLGSAIRLFKQNYASTVRELGIHHPNIRTARSSLAQVYRQAGDFQHAIPLLEEILAENLQRLGPHHEDTLHARTNTALAYMEAELLPKAIPLFEENLSEWQDLCGPTHVQSQLACHKLGYAYFVLGDITRAIPMLERSEADVTRIFGEDHEISLDVRINLAVAYEKASQPGRAVPLIKRNLASITRLHGQDDERTLGLAMHLAITCGTAGELASEISLIKQVQISLSRNLGEDAPEIQMLEEYISLKASELDRRGDT